MLIVGTFTDIDHWIIPDSITWGGTGVALLATIPLGFISHNFITANSGPFVGSSFYIPFCNAVVGAVFGYLLLYLVGIGGKILFRKEAMGMGDMKLFAFVGAVLGWVNCIYVLFLASVIGAVFGISFLLAQKIVSASISKRGVAQPLTQEEEKGSLSATVSSSKSELEQKVLSNIFESSTEIAVKTHHPLPFGPYIAVASYVVLLYSEKIHTAIRLLLGFPEF
jgi:prepilin signal peptidase PulO-like enzyme (type II secretory pathway)